MFEVHRLPKPLESDKVVNLEYNFRLYIVFQELKKKLRPCKVSDILFFSIFEAIVCVII